MIVFRYLIAAGSCAALLICSTPAFSAPEEHRNRDYEVAVAKGMFSLETNDLSSAAAFFNKALAAKPGDKAASIGLSAAYSREGNYQNAKNILLKALANDPSDARIRYELGIVMYKLGEPEEAKDFFAAVIEGRAEESLKSAARRYLEIIAGKGAGEKKGLSIGLLGGLQYDSNVILEQDNPAAAQQQRKTDSRAVLSLDGKYRFLQSETTTGDAGYQFYQSLHRNLHDFNIQQHSLTLAATHDLSSSTKAGVKYTFSYTLAGGAHFSTLNETIPFVTVAFTPASLTEFHFICDKGRFMNSTLFPLNAQQSGTDRTVGFLHTIRMGATSSVSLGYDYDAEEANERFWSYQGNKGQLGYQHVMGAYTAMVSASYYDRKYREDIAAGHPQRHDGVQEYSLDVSRSIAKDLSLSLSDLYTVNDSNLPAYTYTRNILGIFVVTRL
jgi:tetratricopeptide (TPR) repeat protein